MSQSISDISDLSLNSPIQPLNDVLLAPFGVQVDIKRDDLIDPLISGNKWRKLTGHVASLSNQQQPHLVTMGGVWSNHVHATARLCALNNWQCTAIIRGPEPSQLTPMLTDIQHWNSGIKFISREDYRQLRTASEASDDEMIQQLTGIRDAYFIPEGGNHSASLEGFKTLAEQLAPDYHAIYMAVGTGTSLAGVLSHYRNPETQFHGILALQAGDSQAVTIEQLTGEHHDRLHLNADCTFGGFAKTTQALNEFIYRVWQATGLITEPVYTAKALYALYQDVQRGLYPEDSRLLFIHTGGLQGLRGYQDRRLQELCRQAGF